MLIKAFYSVVQALSGSTDAPASVRSAKGSTSFLREESPSKAPESFRKGIEEFRGIKGTIPLSEALKSSFKSF